MTAEQSALLERLEANLPVCPFDPKAPKHDLQPEDACPVCGGLGTYGAENVCKGADTRVMADAAALIRSMQETIERLEGERDALRAKLANSMQFAGEQSPLVCGSGTASNRQRNVVARRTHKEP